MTFSRSLLFAGSLALLAACHEQTTQASQETAAPTPAGPQCYAYRTETDTVRLTLQTTQPTVTGQLAYRYFEKDRNQGTIKGVMHGDTLLADYTFQSEGSQSVREVAFLRRDIGFVEGYGPVMEQGNKTIFKLPRTLHFDAKYTLLPVPCPK
ncbi:MAG: hypothetical protein ACRYF0_20080 [Janthinobacterium lividum]